MQNPQLTLALIPHQVGVETIQQRSRDGYISATQLCKAAGKNWADYARIGPTKEFLAVLEADMGRPISELIQSLKGGSGPQGTWVHPQVAINLGQWLSPQFAVLVSKWVYDWMSGKGAPAANQAAVLPEHLSRYVANDSKVPTGFFSALQETALALYAPLHAMGFTIPSGWVPDISVGQCFCRWLRDIKGFDTKTLDKYPHAYLDGRVTPSNLYPDDLLPDFRKWVREVWLPTYGLRYFQKKDPASLTYLGKLPGVLAPPAKAA